MVGGAHPVHQPPGAGRRYAPVRHFKWTDREGATNPPTPSNVPGSSLTMVLGVLPSSSVGEESLSSNYQYTYSILTAYFDADTSLVLNIKAKRFS